MDSSSKKSDERGKISVNSVLIMFFSGSKCQLDTVSMARKNYLRVIGVVENLSHYVAPDGSVHEIFGSGGGDYLAHEAGVPLLGKIPIEQAVATGGDDGKPVALQLGATRPGSGNDPAIGPGPAALAFGALARLIATEVSPPIEMTGCTAHIAQPVPSETAVQIG